MKTALCQIRAVWGEAMGGKIETNDMGRACGAYGGG